MENTPYELLNGRNPIIAYFGVFGCKCYILKKGTRLSKFENKCDGWFLLGYSTTSKAYRVWNNTTKIVEEVHDVEFDETKGSQDEDENLDDVKGTQLVNSMKNMDIGDIRPREVIDVEDEKDQVLPPPNVQANENQASTSGTHDEAQVQQVEDQQASSSQANQANDQSQVLQPTHIARDYPLDQIVGDIRSGVQTKSRLASFCEHYSFVASFEPTKKEDALMDVDWVNAMHEELNNFTRNQV
ncbi:uncharacterized protein [Miscanthus floridulus]|uniref:uncharacterized protein n=1 Tax=Miscanthus floridulus TaxID=154761 RepID=UPI00345B11D7